MSGDRVVIMIAGNPAGQIGRLVETAARLGAIELGRWAVVGGLAVACRLLVSHRVTDDLDAVVETTHPSALQIISQTIGTHDAGGGHRVTVDGVKVDVIDTEPFTADQLDGIDSENQLFVIAHRWALESATPVTIRVHGSNTTADVALATPAALVAAKTHALLSRRAARAGKHGSDAFDIYRLLLAHDSEGQLARELMAAPFDLGSLLAHHLGQMLIDDAERSVRWLRQGTPEMRVITATDLRNVARPFCEQLR